MKKILLFFLLLGINSTLIFAQQRTIKGVVIDEHNHPLSYANVFIKGTSDGTSSDDKGVFNFKTSKKGEITLSALMLGYTPFNKIIANSQTEDLIIKLKPNSITLDNVVITAGNFRLKGNSQWGGNSAVDLVTSGGSTGDLYRSLQTLPGAQVVGESGKLFVRGGDSNESQTYIDEMHVLTPYTTSGANEAVRGRYSPFMFDGINFSTGGYSSEYAQGLSSVLPLSTKDSSPITKIGLNPSTVGVAGGGTIAFDKASVSLNLDYQNLSPYHKIFPGRLTWISPYQIFSGGSQVRFNLDKKTVFKTYLGYDRTSFAQQLTSLEDNTQRDFKLKEDNIYVNSTLQKETEAGYKLFAGAAFSFKNQNLNDALVANDLRKEKEWEIHLKAKASKRINNLLRLTVGIENFSRYYQSIYADNKNSYNNSLYHSIGGLFATANINLTSNLSSELSSRIEYTDLNKTWNYAPRAALMYNLNGIHLSGIIGKYMQMPQNRYLLLNNSLSTENCLHYIAGIYYEKMNKIYRVEAYYKKYSDLALNMPDKLSSGGYGYSKGVDLFFNDKSLLKNFEYVVSYSFNISKRKYQEYSELTIPQFASKHNGALSLKYTLPALKSIIGITNRIASGRPYHDPTKEGIMNATTSYYNSLDLSITYLANKKLLIYASANNILNRTNVYNYNYVKDNNQTGGYRSLPVIASSNCFFYVGVFITLSGKTAYDVSNF